MQLIFKDRRYYRGVLLFFALLSVCPVYALDIKYADLERMTLEGNSSVAAAELRWQAQEKRAGFFWKSFMPRFDLVGGYETFQTGIYGQETQAYGTVSATISLFNGFRDLNEGRLREAHALLGRVNSSMVSHEKLSQVRQLYLQLAYCKELETTYQSIGKINERVKKSAQVRQNRGLVTATDLYEFDLYGGKLQEEIESLRHERHILSIKLSAALGMSERHDLNPVDTLEHTHTEDVTTKDYASLPTAGRMRIQAEDSVQMAEASFRASWWMPSVDAYAGYFLYTLREREFISYRDRDDWAAGLRATWVLFNFELFSQSRAASLEEKASSKDTQQKTLDFHSEVRSRQEELIHVHELIHNSEERLKLGEKYLASTQSDYDRGVKNSPDVISAIDKLIAIRKELLERKLEYQKTRDRLTTLTQNM